MINTIRSGEPVVMVINQTDLSIQQSFLSIQDQFTEMINAVNLNPFNSLS